ncbi:Zinc finger protein 771 like protein [Argiope bruennichi]|uniref:Zinc finger protein 771 like protein n=1 Tax=Argiope bruennichi TaxID=94029 RepID=A0A8T0EGD2_ARGBR|nr:Zinc finger protein 771 like protein [Argiope bruennichi]
MTPATKKHFICNTLGMEFSEKKALSQHFRTDAKEKLHTCSICYREFSHTEEKGYSCDICSERFSRESDFDERFCSETNEKRISGSLEVKPMSKRKLEKTVRDKVTATLDE